jgi:hypothetical protein
LRVSLKVRFAGREVSVEYGGDERGHVVPVQPGLAGPPHPVVQLGSQRGVVGGRGAQGAPHEGAESAPGLHEPFALQFPVGLEDGVGVDGGGFHDLAGRGQLVAGAQQTQAQGLLGLLRDLDVGGHAAVPVDAVLEHADDHPLTN